MQNKFFQKKYIPNYLTIFRGLLTIPIFILLLLGIGAIYFPDKSGGGLPSNSNGSFYDSPFTGYGVVSKHIFIAGILFLIAIMTDWIDGYIARKYKWVSKFGKIFDPAIDKVLINSILIVFSSGQLVPVWIVVPLIVRDILVDSSRVHAINTNKNVAANVWGKLKTITQMLAICMILFIIQAPYNALNDGAPDGNWGVMYFCVQNGLMFVALLFSLISGVIYIKKYWSK